MLERLELAGLKGPTVAQVYTHQGDNWYAVTVVVPQASLQETVDHFRAIGGTGVSVLKPRYVFHEVSQIYQKMLKALNEY